METVQAAHSASAMSPANAGGEVARSTRSPNAVKCGATPIPPSCRHANSRPASRTCPLLRAARTACSAPTESIIWSDWFIEPTLPSSSRDVCTGTHVSHCRNRPTHRGSRQCCGCGLNWHPRNGSSPYRRWMLRGRIIVASWNLCENGHASNVHTRSIRIQKPRLQIRDRLACGFVRSGSRPRAEIVAPPPAHDARAQAVRSRAGAAARRRARLRGVREHRNRDCA